MARHKTWLSHTLPPRVFKPVIRCSADEDSAAEPEEESLQLVKYEDNRQHGINNKDILQLKKNIKQHQVTKYHLVKRTKTLEQNLLKKISSIQRTIDNLKAEKLEAQKDVESLQSTLSEMR